jgi:cytochrome P450
MFHHFIVFLTLITKAIADSIHRFATPDWGWAQKHTVFEKLGTDAFIIVSPGKNLVSIADPEAIAQITTRRVDFPKPIDLYGSLDVFGKNVVSTEGAIWRHHRKICSPPFTERNNRVVWQESLHQAKTMMAGWMSPDDKVSKPLYDVSDQAMRLSLHVISRAGFDVRLTWPHEEGSTQEAPAGHKLTFKDALTNLLENLLVVLIFPKWMLKWVPHKTLNETYEAYVEWGQYMREMYVKKRGEVESGEAGDGMDLMGALVRGAGFSADTKSDSPPGSPGHTEKSAGNPSPSKPIFSEDEILGNAFVFILAGHETAANTIHFACMFLAMHPSSQRRLQQDLDALLGDRPSDEWDYDEDVPKLFGNMAGAVMNEELRVLPPVVGIPKTTARGYAQGLTIGGKPYTIPEDSFISLSTPGAHRNPKFWPHTSLEDLNDFRPERWLLDENSSKLGSNDEKSTEPGPDAEGPDQRSDTASNLFRPVKGSYVPFSDGYRSCIGRRFAQVEILAVLAVIFKTWSVELDVSMFLKDGETEETLSEERKKEVWKLADERTRELLRTGMGTIVTIQIRKGKVPMRFVKRGSERFSPEVVGK